MGTRTHQSYSANRAQPFVVADEISAIDAHGVRNPLASTFWKRPTISSQFAPRFAFAQSRQGIAAPIRSDHTGIHPIDSGIPINTETTMQTNDIYFNQKTRDGYAKWAEQSQYEYFVTLTFRGDITSAKTADDAIETFYKDLCFALFGKPTRRRIPFMAVRERHASGGWHWHILLSPPSDGKWRPEKLKEAVRSSWVKRGGPNSDPKEHNPDDMQWFQQLIGKEHREKAYAYVCKRIMDAETVNIATLHPAEHLQLTSPSMTATDKTKPMRKKPNRHYPAKAKPGSPTSSEARKVAHNFSRKGFASSGN